MQSNNQFEVAVIGGGLAGLTLAIQCADAGFAVVLFEKEKYPFHKVCGEYISLESWGFLNRIGLNMHMLNLPLIKLFEVTDVKGSEYAFKLPLGGFGISRYTLDNLLYQLALKKNVTVMTDVKVQDVQLNNECFYISTSHQNYCSKVVVASYGKRSNLDVKWKRSFVQQKPNKLNNYIGVKYHIRYPQPKEKITLHNFHNGYCGISNIEDGKCCLCYLTTAENLRKNSNSVDRMQKSVLSQNPHLKAIFANAEFLYEQPLAISQISFEKKSQVEDHVLMAGDAAGMITPLCGNGMSMAMHASKIAFDCVDEFLKGLATREQMEMKYIRQWQEAFSKRLFTGRVVQRLFGGNTSTSLFFKTMHGLPFLARQIIKSTHGEPF